MKDEFSIFLLSVWSRERNCKHSFFVSHANGEAHSVENGYTVGNNIAFEQTQVRDFLLNLSPVSAPPPSIWVPLAESSLLQEFELSH